MTIEISEEAKRVLSREELEIVRESLDQFEAQAAIPKDPNGMRQDKTDFPLGIYDSYEE
jgi:ubiquitin